MQHPNKNRLLEYFYKESSELEFKKIREHLNSCALCRDYLYTLEETIQVLDQLPKQVPAENTFDSIIKDMDILPKKSVKKRQIISAFPYFQIGLSIPFILAVIYFFQNELSLLPVWEALEKIWIIEKLGSFGLVSIIFFLIGSFITMALAPVLLLDSGIPKNNDQKYNLSWR